MKLKISNKKLKVVPASFGEKNLKEGTGDFTKGFKDLAFGTSAEIGKFLGLSAEYVKDVTTLYARVGYAALLNTFKKEGSLSDFVARSQRAKRDFDESSARNLKRLDDNTIGMIKSAGLSNEMIDAFLLGTLPQSVVAEKVINYVSDHNNLKLLKDAIRGGLSNDISSHIDKSAIKKGYSYCVYNIIRSNLLGELAEKESNEEFQQKIIEWTQEKSKSMHDNLTVICRLSERVRNVDVLYSSLRSSKIDSGDIEAVKKEYIKKITSTKSADTLSIKSGNIESNKIDDNYIEKIKFILMIHASLFVEDNREYIAEFYKKELSKIDDDFLEKLEDLKNDIEIAFCTLFYTGLFIESGMSFIKSFKPASKGSEFASLLKEGMSSLDKEIISEESFKRISGLVNVISNDFQSINGNEAFAVCCDIVRKVANDFLAEADLNFQIVNNYIEVADHMKNFSPQNSVKILEACKKLLNSKCKESNIIKVIKEIETAEEKLEEKIKEEANKDNTSNTPSATTATTPEES